MSSCDQVFRSKVSFSIDSVPQLFISVWAITGEDVNKSNRQIFIIQGRATPKT